MLNTDEVGLVSSSMRFTTGRFSASRSQGEKNPNYLLVKQHLEFRASLLYLSGCTHKIPIVTSYMSKGFPLGTPTPYKITLTQENNLSYQRKHGKNSQNKMDFPFIFSKTSRAAGIHLHPGFLQLCSPALMLIVQPHHHMCSCAEVRRGFIFTSSIKKVGKVRHTSAECLKVLKVFSW